MSCGERHVAKVARRHRTMSLIHNYLSNNFPVEIDWDAHLIEFSSRRLLSQKETSKIKSVSELTKEYTKN